MNEIGNYYILAFILLSLIANNRYATSKIVTESDLDTSINYGFRGEALHSLVKLSRKVSILSSTTNSGFGICKTFLETGSQIILENKPLPKGTVVSIEGLFECISIRRQDWFKRKSSIFAQAIFLIQTFAIFSKGVKFSVFNVKENSSKVPILFSSGADLKSRYIECMKLDQKNVESFNSNFVVKDMYIYLFH